MKLKMLPSLIAAALSFSTLSMAEDTGGGAAAEPSKPRFAKKSYDESTGVVSIEFGNGKVVELDTNTCSPEMKTLLMLHGASQKIGDSYAGAKGDFASAVASAQAVVDQLLAGEWTSSGEERGPRLAELAEAIARIKGVPVEKAMAAVEKATDEQRKGFRANAQVKAAIAQARAEKAQKALEAAGSQELSVDLG